MLSRIGNIFVEVIDVGADLAHLRNPAGEVVSEIRDVQPRGPLLPVLVLELGAGDPNFHVRVRIELEHSCLERVDRRLHLMHVSDPLEPRDDLRHEERAHGLFGGACEAPGDISSSVET